MASTSSTAWVKDRNWQEMSLSCLRCGWGILSVGSKLHISFLKYFSWIIWSWQWMRRIWIITRTFIHECDGYDDWNMCLILWRTRVYNCWLIWIRVSYVNFPPTSRFLLSLRIECSNTFNPEACHESSPGQCTIIDPESPDDPNNNGQRCPGNLRESCGNNLPGAQEPLINVFRTHEGDCQHNFRGGAQVTSGAWRLINFFKFVIFLCCRWEKLFILLVTLLVHELCLIMLSICIRVYPEGIWQ